MPDYMATADLLPTDRRLPICFVTHFIQSAGPMKELEPYVIIFNLRTIPIYLPCIIVNDESIRACSGFFLVD